MAKFQGSAVVGDVRNKAGGVVFSKNHSGSMIRNKVSGVQPQTRFQRSARSVLAAITDQWKNHITAAQRLKWEILAEQLADVDKFGNPKKWTGYLVFLRVNTNRHHLFTTFSHDAPANLDVQQPQYATWPQVPQTNSTYSIYVTPTPGSHTITVQEGAPPTGPGRNARASDYRFLSASNQGNPGPFYEKTLIIERFGTTRTGQKLHARLHFINADNYWDSQRVTQSMTLL